MIWAKITDASERVRRAREKLFKTPSARFWGTLGLTMPFVASDEIETMATDAVSIFYNPAYVMTLSEPECMGVIAHEISHPALRHFARQGTRDVETWNIAADYELNLDLIKAGLTLPEHALIDQRFDGLSAEQIFSVVSRENEQDKENGNTPRHQPQSGNMLTPTDALTGQPMSGDQKQALYDAWDSKVSQTLGAARKAGLLAGGHIPTSLVAISETLKTSNLIDWRQPLRAFIDNLGSRYTTWRAFNRRGVAHGLNFPGSKVVRPSLVGFFIDVSGSMDKAKVRQALAEAQAALDDMACDAIELVYTDTSVLGVERYEVGETIVLKDGMGGGTDFRAAMRHASENEYAAIVFITDGQTTSFGSEPDCPVLWAITDTIPATERLSPPFGEKLCLYTS
jgi:predicted metal-dependent peptidase